MYFLEKHTKLYSNFTREYILHSGIGNCYQKSKFAVLKIIPYFHLHAQMLEKLQKTELQIRGSIEDNSKIIFLISQRKHML